MKMIILIILLSICFRLSAPEYKTLPIERSESIDPYKAIKRAIGYVESRNRDSVINYNEMAFGRYQARQCRVDDYNFRTNSNFTLTDMLDSVKAEKVLIYYACLIGYRNPERIAIEWNGGPNGNKYKETKEYWEKVQKVLLSL